MSAETAFNALKEKFGDKILGDAPEAATGKIKVSAGAWVEVNKFLKDDPSLAYVYHCSLTAVDLKANEKIEIVNLLRSIENKATAIVSAEIDRNKPEIDSLVPLWKGANWPEREVYDLFGVNFKNHPDQKRIMMPEEWVGHPLLKDYEYVEPDWYEKRFDQVNIPVPPPPPPKPEAKAPAAKPAAPKPAAADKAETPKAEAPNAEAAPAETPAATEEKKPEAEKPADAEPKAEADRAKKEEPEAKE